MAQETTSDKKPPYISFVTLKNFLTGLGKSVIPARVDKGLMSGLAGGTQTYLLSTLKFLGLIGDDFVPTADLAPIVRGDKAAWDRVVKRSYAFIFDSGVDLKSGTELQVLELFGAQGVTGDTRRKCLSLFSACCELAGIELGPHIKGRPGSTGSAPRKARKPRTASAAKGETENGEDDPTPTPEGHSQATLPLTKDGTRMVKLTAPSTVTAAELKRIQAWLGFQLIVEDEK